MHQVIGHGLKSSPADFLDSKDFGCYAVSSLSSDQFRLDRSRIVHFLNLAKAQPTNNFTSTMYRIASLGGKLLL